VVLGLGLGAEVLVVVSGKPAYTRMTARNLVKE